MYSHSGGDTPEEAAANAKKRVEQGFDAIKISPDAPVEHIDHLGYVDALAEKFCAIRGAVGKNVDIAIDFHGRIMAGMASRLIDAIAPYYPMFVEEPVLPENVEVMASIAAKTSVPIATGERLFTQVVNVLEQHAAVVLQPDTCHCGGIFEVRKIASMAEMYYASVAPHNPLGPISLAACLQVDACTPNFLIQEHPGMAEGWDRGVGYLKKPFEIVNSFIDVPTAPGLGIEVDEDYVRSHTFNGDWDTPAPVPYGRIGCTVVNIRMTNGLFPPRLRRALRLLLRRAGGVRRCPKGELHMKRVITFGEIMLRLSPPGFQRFAQAKSFDVVYGGAESNASVSLANYGLSSAFATLVPDNPIGQAAVNELRAFGVDTKFMLRKGKRLGIYFYEKGRVHAAFQGGLRSQGLRHCEHCARRYRLGRGV